MCPAAGASPRRTTPGYRTGAALAVCLLVLLGARQGFAQVPPAEAAAPAQPTAGFQDGFFIQSADGRNRVTFSTLMHFDGRFVPDDPSASVNTFTLRRVRLGLTARFGKVFEVRFNPELGNGAAFIQDMYLDVNLSSAVRVRMGKYKIPLGYEMLITAPRIVMPERALASNLVPNRDVGVQVMGDLAGGRVSYAGGVFNGSPDGGSALDGDTNRAKDLIGSVEVRPFRGAAATARPRDGLGFRLAGSTGQAQGPLFPFRTSVLRPFFAYANGVETDGARHRLSPSVFYWHRSVGAFAEYFRSTQTVVRDETRSETTNTGWAVTGTYLLTGEQASATRATRPKHDINPDAHHWGAFQIVARFSTLSIDPAAFASRVVVPGSSQRATQASVGLNWYATPYVKYVAMVERTGFDAPSRQPAEHAIMLRTQVAF